jgi:proline iminopeptidase
MEERYMVRFAGVLFLVLSTFVSAQETGAPAKTDEAGVRMIPITTPKGTFNVWTRTLGENPSARVLILHGGPGATHEYLSIVAEKSAAAGFEAIEYDQLGSAFSDQPKEPDLWEVDRFVDEVEQVRAALELDRDNFYLYGHSWGGVLAIEYALRYPDHLKGIVISNMMSSIPAYNEYAKKVLMPQMDQKALAEILAMEEAHDTGNPRYDELLMEHYYTEHILRRSADQWPAEVVASFEKMNHDIYVPMQGPSEMGASGKLLHWDRSGDLSKIKVPTLVIGAKHDTMDPEHMEWMSRQFPDGHYLGLSEGSHLAMHDDTDRYFAGLISFLSDIESR